MRPDFLLFGPLRKDRVRPTTLAAAGLAALLLTAAGAGATEVRVKDIAKLSGVRDNQLVGYGLVVGLDGSGDSAQTLFTNQSVAAMLSRLGVRVDPKSLRTRNVAAVMVTALLPPFATPGSTIDVDVASTGDARSIRGGTLVMTPLKASNGETYAVAQGPLTVGGFSAARAGTSVTKNHPTAGRIPGGATVERPAGIELRGRKELVYVLVAEDFTTAENVAKAITGAGARARAVDSRRVIVEVPAAEQENPVPLIARIEIATLATDARARVVVNARTGTVVMGSNVRLSAVALAHGGLQVEIASDNEVSQPSPLSSGVTRGVRNSRVTAMQAAGSVKLLKETATLGDLVAALNTLGVSPQDLIDVLQAVRGAGALNAEIEIQ